MKMIIGAELPEGYSPSHDDLAASSATLIAHALMPLFTDNMSEDMARANVEGIVTELAYLFDEGAIEMGGKTYRPHLAFVDDTGATLPGAAELTTLSDLSSEPFNLEPAAQISFQEPEYDE